MIWKIIRLQSTNYANAESHTLVQINRVSVEICLCPKKDSVQVCMDVQPPSWWGEKASLTHSLIVGI